MYKVFNLLFWGPVSVLELGPNYAFLYKLIDKRIGTVKKQILNLNRAIASEENREFQWMLIVRNVNYSRFSFLHLWM